MGKKNPYMVPIAAIPQGRYEQDFECDTEFFRHMENDEITDADVKVRLECEHKNDSYDCTFLCRGKIGVPCDRCLDPIMRDVDATYHVIVRYGEDFDDSRDGLLVIPDNERWLDVSQIIYDTIVLTVPMRNVHAAGECNQDMVKKFSEHLAVSEDADSEDEA